jgi:hypothetical protein
VGHGDQGQNHHRRRGAPPEHATNGQHHESDLAGKVERNAGAEGDGGNEVQMVVQVVERGLEPERFFLCGRLVSTAPSLEVRLLKLQLPGHNCGVQFSAELRDRVADGTITVSYRLWSRPQVKVGGVYRSGAVTIEVDEIELLPFSSITDEDLARTGEPDIETLRRRAAHAGPIHDDTFVYRVEFHVL